MDITAFNELIALARETAASLAQAEQKVAAFKEELAEQAKDAQCNAAAAPVRSIKSIPKRQLGLGGGDGEAAQGFLIFGQPASTSTSLEVRPLTTFRPRRLAL